MGVLSRIAGSDTSSTSLSYFFWELSRRPDIMKKLQAELDETMADPLEIPDISVLQRLPYLNAFIKEGEFPHPPFISRVFVSSPFELTLLHVLHTLFDTNPNYLSYVYRPTTLRRRSESP
jgi:Cytochrome P450